MGPERSRRRAAAWLAVAVVGLVVTLYGPQIADPFVQDDWLVLELLDRSPSGLVLDSLDPRDHLFYRPVGSIYFALIDFVSQREPIAFHLVNLGLLTFSSLMVAGTLRKLGAGPVTAAGSALLFAAAVRVHLEPTMWMVGFYELGAMSAFLATLWLGLAGRPMASALVMTLGLGIKEPVLLAPLVLAVALFVGHDGATRARVRNTAMRMRPHAIVLIAYVFLRALGASPAGLPPDHPYSVAFGGNLLTNLGRYTIWLLEALTPWKDLDIAPTPVGWASLLLFVGMIGGLWVASRRRWVPTSMGLVAILGAWALGGVAPLLVMPNHAFTYYLSIALPALIALLLVAAGGLARIVRLPRPAAIALLAVLLLANAVSGYRFVSGKRRLGVDAPASDGTNHLVRRAAIVRQVMSDLPRLLPSVPSGSTLVFANVEIWAFHANSGPRVWYSDPTLSVLEGGAVRAEEGQLVGVVAPEDRAYLELGRIVEGAPGALVRLDPRRTFFLGLADGRLRLYAPPRSGS